VSDDPNCIFCKIVRGDIPAKEAGRNDVAIAFADVNPVAPVHYLVIPRRHAADLGDFAEASGDHEVGALFRLASQLGREASPSGYRLVTNEGRDAGQTVFHLHVHVLAGRAMAWPPG
jgi:diadenosine tetraphosphate (Ap4A) HIT family hydrolase